MKRLKGAPPLSIFGFCLFKMFVSNKFLMARKGLLFSDFYNRNCARIKKLLIFITNSFMARKGLYLLIFITETVQELKSSFNSCTV